MSMVGLHQAEVKPVVECINIKKGYFLAKIPLIIDTILEKPQTSILEHFFSKEKKKVLKTVPSCIIVQNPKNNLT